MGQAPADEKVYLVAVMPHRIIGGISFSNNPADKFGIVQDEIHPDRAYKQFCEGVIVA